MDEWIEVSAKTTEEAVTEALIKLGTTSDKVEYEVLEKESRGFLGIGSRPARIRAKIKKEALEEPAEEQLMPKEEAKPAKETVENTNHSEKEEAEKKQPVNDRPHYKESRSYHRENKNFREKGENQEYKNPYSSSSFQAASGQEMPVTAVNENEKEPVKIENAEELKQDAEKFLHDIFDVMKMNAKMQISFREEETTIEIELEGEDMGILIGKRGQTLDSLQYLVSLVVNKKSSSYVKVKLDTENYRERRKETLENLAKNIAFKVKRTKRPVTLEPMNPYERRIIHSALQYDKFVETHSEGEEPYRKVVVTLKRREYGNNRRGKYRRDYNYKRDYNNYKKARQAEKEAESQAKEE